MIKTYMVKIHGNDVSFLVLNPKDFRFFGVGVYSGFNFGNNFQNSSLSNAFSINFRWHSTDSKHYLNIINLGDEFFILLRF